MTGRLDSGNSLKASITVYKDGRFEPLTNSGRIFP